MKSTIQQLIDETKKKKTVKCPDCLAYYLKGKSHECSDLMKMLVKFHKEKSKKKVKKSVLKIKKNGCVGFGGPNPSKKLIVSNTQQPIDETKKKKFKVYFVKNGKTTELILIKKLPKNWGKISYKHNRKNAK